MASRVLSIIIKNVATRKILGIFHKWLCKINRVCYFIPDPAHCAPFWLPEGPTVLNYSQRLSSHVGHQPSCHYQFCPFLASSTVRSWIWPSSEWLLMAMQQQEGSNLALPVTYTIFTLGFSHSAWAGSRSGSPSLLLAALLGTVGLCTNILQVKPWKLLWASREAVFCFVWLQQVAWITPFCLLHFSAPLLPWALSQQALGIVTSPFLVTHPLSLLRGTLVQTHTHPHDRATIHLSLVSTPTKSLAADSDHPLFFPVPPPLPPPKQPLLKFKINWLWHHVWLLVVTRQPGRDFYKVHSIPSIFPLFLSHWHLAPLPFLPWLQCLKFTTRGHTESTVVNWRDSPVCPVITTYDDTYIMLWSVTIFTRLFLFLLFSDRQTQTHKALSFDSAILLATTIY